MYRPSLPTEVDVILLSSFIDGPRAPMSFVRAKKRAETSHMWELILFRFAAILEMGLDVPEWHAHTHINDNNMLSGLIWMKEWEGGHHGFHWTNIGKLLICWPGLTTPHKHLFLVFFIVCCWVNYWKLIWLTLAMISGQRLHFLVNSYCIKCLNMRQIVYQGRYNHKNGYMENAFDTHL